MANDTSTPTVGAMKAERRHELQTNDLAGWLSQVIKDVQPYSTQIMVGIGVLALLIVGVLYLSNRSQGHSATAWDDYYVASSIEEPEQRIAELRRVADQNPDSIAGVWALQTAADTRLLRGANLSYKDREKGEEELLKAKEMFQEVLKKATSFPASEGDMLRRGAMFGLAQTYESLAEPDKAIEQYEEISQTWPESAMGKTAAKRIDYLKSLSDWYEWYASVDPSKIERTMQQDQRPQSKPVEDDLLLPSTDLNRPGSGGDLSFDDLIADPADPADPADNENDQNDQNDQNDDDGNEKGADDNEDGANKNSADKNGPEKPEGDATDDGPKDDANEADPDDNASPTSSPEIVPEDK